MKKNNQNQQKKQRNWFLKKCLWKLTNSKNLNKEKFAKQNDLTVETLPLLLIHIFTKAAVNL